MIKVDKSREPKSELVSQLFSLSISVIKNWIVSIDSSHSSVICGIDLPFASFFKAISLDKESNIFGSEKDIRKKKLANCLALPTHLQVHE